MIKNLFNNALLNSMSTTNSIMYSNKNNVLKKIHCWNKYMNYIKPYYAVKSNPEPSLINLLHENNISFDVASIKEINTVNKITNNIIYSNPCRSPIEISYAKKCNLKMLVVDSIDEINKIKDIYPTAEIIIRVKSHEEFSSITFNSKFGASENKVYDIINYAYKHKLNVVGFSYHVGSKCSDMNAHRLTIDTIISSYFPYLLKKIKPTYKIIDIGGGFINTNDIINFDKINSKLVKNIINQGIKFIAEPGRYFCQDYFSLITTVKSIRHIKKNNYALSINDSIYHSFNGIVNDRQSYIPKLLKMNKVESPIVNCTVFGQTCDSGDIICSNVSMELPSVNDKLIFKNIGAYSMTKDFNGFYDADIVT